MNVPPALASLSVAGKVLEDVCHPWEPSTADTSTSHQPSLICMRPSGSLKSALSFRSGCAFLQVKSVYVPLEEPIGWNA